MCLNTLLSIKRNQNQYGYKLFAKWNEQIILPYKGTNQSILETNWVNEKDYRSRYFIDSISLSTDLPDVVYHFGFHIFLKLEDSKKYEKDNTLANPIIYLIQFKNVVAYGLQNNMKVIVAKDIKLIQEI